MGTERGMPLRRSLGTGFLSKHLQRAYGSLDFRKRSRSSERVGWAMGSGKPRGTIVLVIAQILSELQIRVYLRAHSCPTHLSTA